MKALQKFRLTAWPSFAADKGVGAAPGCGAGGPLSYNASPSMFWVFLKILAIRPQDLQSLSTFSDLHSHIQAAQCGGESGYGNGKGTYRINHQTEWQILCPCDLH